MFRNLFWAACISLASAGSYAGQSCSRLVDRVLEASDIESSIHLRRDTGEGLVAFKLLELNSRVQDLARDSKYLAFNNLGPGKHRIEFLATHPGKDFVSENEFRLKFGSELWVELMNLAHSILEIANKKLPSDERSLKIISADIRYVFDDDSISNYTHYDYYQGDYLVGIVSFLGPGLSIKPNNVPTEESETFEQGVIALFNAVDRWQAFHGVTESRQAQALLKPYMDISAAKKREANMGGGPDAIHESLKSLPGVLPRIHHAPFLNPKNKMRISFSIVLGR